MGLCLLGRSFLAPAPTTKHALASNTQSTGRHSRHPLQAQHRRARSALYFYTGLRLRASIATLTLGSWLPLSKTHQKHDLPLFERVCRLVGMLSSPGRVVALVHPVHLAYGLKTRYFLK